MDDTNRGPCAKLLGAGLRKRRVIAASSSNARVRAISSLKDGIEPYGKSVSLLCELQVDL